MHIHLNACHSTFPELHSTRALFHMLIAACLAHHHHSAHKCPAFFTLPFSSLLYSILHLFHAPNHRPTHPSPLLPPARPPTHTVPPAPLSQPSTRCRPPTRPTCSPSSISSRAPPNSKRRTRCWPRCPPRPRTDRCQSHSPHNRRRHAMPRYVFLRTLPQAVFMHQQQQSRIPFRFRVSLEWLHAPNFPKVTS